jgi:hypothetical protein
VVRLQCVAALVLGVAVLLSALFWLPPFAGRGGAKEGPDPGDEFGGERSTPRIARSRFRSPVVAEWRLFARSAFALRWEFVGGCSALDLDARGE